MAYSGEQEKTFPNHGRLVKHFSPGAVLTE
jgi:hypothetical protein